MPYYNAGPSGEGVPIYALWADLPSTGSAGAVYYVTEIESVVTWSPSLARYIPVPSGGALPVEVEDASGNPLAFWADNDALGALLAGAWSAPGIAPTEGTDVTIGERVINIANPAGGNCQLMAIPSAWPTKMMVWAEIEPVSVGPGYNSDVFVSIRNGARRLDITWSRGGTLDRLGWAKDYTANTGSGPYTPTADYQPFWAVINTASGQLCSLFDEDGTDVAVSWYSNFNTTAENKFMASTSAQMGCAYGIRRLGLFSLDPE